jgi:hypothetical protein
MANTEHAQVRPTQRQHDTSSLPKTTQNDHDATRTFISETTTYTTTNCTLLYNQKARAVGNLDSLLASTDAIDVINAPSVDLL